MEIQDNEWRGRIPAWDAQETGYSILRMTLLFGSIAIAIALLAVPVLQSEVRQAAGGRAAGLDSMATGSIRKGERYTMRRSVLQNSPDAVCVYHDNGSRSGSC